MKSLQTLAAFAMALSAPLAMAGQLHVFTSGAAGFNTHSVWYDDGKEVTVIDSQFTPAFAQELVADIKKQTTAPITRVIVTHPNPDKFNGLSVFHALGAKSYGSKATAAAMPEVDAYKRYFWVKIAKAFTDDSYPKMESLQNTFDKNLVLTMKSGETLTLTELDGPGVAGNQTVVRIDKTGDLVVGDLVHSRNHAWLEGGVKGGKAGATLASWRADLAQLPALAKGKPQAKIYGGRGQFLLVKQAVDEQTAYLHQADAIVARYITRLGNKVSELSDPATQGAHHAALQAEFVKAFPDYAMPDLVGYSVYGLVQAQLNAK